MLGLLILETGDGWSSGNERKEVLRTNNSAQQYHVPSRLVWRNPWGNMGLQSKGGGIGAWTGGGFPPSQNSF